MPAYRFFDPQAALADERAPATPAKAANPAKVVTPAPPTLATLAALAGSPADPASNAALPAWVETEAERAAIVEHDGAIPHTGIPETSEKPRLLRDGRRLWRFQADAIPECTSASAAALIDQAHWCGAVLVADGRELIVVEPWLSSLPPETLLDLRRQAAEVIAALRRQSCARNDVQMP